MSAVVGRRNNWLLSPGKFPDQFLFVIDKNRKLFYLHRARTSKRRGINGMKKKRKKKQQQQVKEGVRQASERETEGGRRVT